MKEKIIIVLLIMCCSFLISCGGNSAGNKGYFGQLPELLLEKNEKLDVINQKGEALSKKGNAGMEDMGKLMDEYTNTEKEYEHLILEEGKKLLNTPVRYSLSDGLPYEISIAPTIKDMGKKGCTAEIHFFLKATQNITLRDHDKSYTVYVKCVDKNGAAVKKEFTTTFKEQNDKTIAAGNESEGKIHIYLDYKKPDEVTKLRNIDQIVFITENDYNTI